MTAPAVRVTGVDFVTIPTQDFEAAVGFYGTVLNLVPGPRWGQMPAMEFQAGDVTLAIMDPTAFGREFSAATMPIALHVEDVAAAREALEAEGVTFHGDTFDSGVCHQAIFSDPDGNPLILHHRYAPKAA
jgi:predicted enzyme related to lactoylglutathione lyase